MDFQLSEEQKMLKKMVHDLTEKEFRPKAAEWEAKGEHMPRKYVTMLANLGLLGLCLPAKYGGQGKTAFEAILAIEELARISSLCAAPVFESNVGPVKVVEQFGTEEQKQKYLPPVCRGESLISIGMTEPEAGSALTDLATRAVLDGDHYVVNGQKRFCTGGGESDAY
ncbi:MAG: acyl-CoA dehydrogenase, partial [Chloroflexi bacterium]|nr:acyl-CoA dehydrogenase [Chloroflexota bacterium]